MAEQPLIRLVGLTRQYRMGPAIVSAVAGVDLEIARGEAVALVGPSGSGKSTLLNLIGGLDRPTTGEIWVDGENVARASARRLVEHRKRRIGFVFQSFNLLPYRTALENVEVPLMLSDLSRGARRQRARELLEQVGLGARTGHRPSQLSGGEQQRVAIARALANKPSILLADEPTGNLDSATGTEVMHLLRDLNADGLTLILVTHDMAVAAYANKMVRLRDGHIIAIEEAANAGAQ
ncbi:MAG TPA: ABC transporter ATP-binding protein [Chloroflexia bacterium]|nr:ABC transporter ATP-binding protein [Chloroflexia bacterium]